MDCSDFLAGFSEFYDAPEGSPARREAMAHLAECEACSRYNAVVERGVELLRSLPRVEVGESFRPRLEHRLFHVADEIALGRGGSASGTTVATAVGMAVLLATVAWAPTLRETVPEVELAPIVVSEPPVREAPAPSTVNLSVPAFFGPNPFAPRKMGDRMWQSSSALFYEYSPLTEKYRANGLFRRTGLD